MRRSIAVLLLVIAPALAGQREERTWGELADLVGRKIRMTTPKAVVVEGTVTALEADALVMQIGKTSDKNAYPKGRYAAPRADLKSLDVLTKGKKFRVIGTIIGAWGGLALGIYAALHTQTAARAHAVLGGVGGGATVAGYLIGDAADSQTLNISVKP